MNKLTIKTGTEEQFFNRGQQLAEVADKGGKLPNELILSFEDPADIMKLMTPARLALFRAVKDSAGSITNIAERLNRDRSAVKRDVDEMERAGLVTVKEKALPGHGRMKEVQATAERFSLQAEFS